MSRQMRSDFGLPPLETRVGLAAQDFALAAAAPEVLLTRASRVEGTPSVQARWLSRMDAVLQGSNLPLPEPPACTWRAWADAIDDPGVFAPWNRPEPCPPLTVRPRKLPVTAIETWMRDPYTLYAQRILNLRALDPLDADPGAAERGQFVHHALDRFIRAFPGTLPADALDHLLREGRAAFGEALAHPSVAAFWWPRFQRVARWFIEFEIERRRSGVRALATETEGGVDLDVDGYPFRLIAKADRIDRMPDGRLAIIDYKTGRPPTAGDVTYGLAPQLPLEAVIAQRGGFPEIPAAPVAELTFLRLAGGEPPGESIKALGKTSPEAAIEEAWAGLLGLVAAFDDPAMPYRSRPRPEVAYPGDYDHLARIEEWASR